MGERRGLAAGLGGLLCLTVLTWMLVAHAWPVWTGEIIYLRVYSAGTRDRSPGDYVVLAYDIDRVTLADPSFPPVEAASQDEEKATAAVGPGPPAPPPPPAAVVRPIGDWWRRDVDGDGGAQFRRSQRLRDKRLYLQLERAPSADPAVPFLLQPVSLAEAPQPGFVNLQGRCRAVSPERPGRGRQALELELHFGIGALFVPERSGIAIDEAIHDGKPVYALIAVAASGKARVTDLLVEGRPFLGSR